jgi:hypothetical protein
MSVWRTKEHGHILWQVHGADRFAEIEPDSETVRMVFERGQSCLEYDEYDWAYLVEGAKLRKRFTTTTYGESPKVKWSTERRLVPLEGGEQHYWVERAPVIYVVYQEGRQLQAQAEQRATMERAASFVVALPADCSDLEFRRLRDGWGVSVPGQDPFWTDRTFRYRGKDMFSELREVLLRLGRLESFVPRMENDDEDRWFQGE